MKILVTGATGYIGHQLAITLAERGNEVHVLVRNPGSINVPLHKNIRVFTGDITNRPSITAAMRECKQVYHTAAKVGLWAKDSSVFYNVNVKGTRNVLDAALQTGVEKSVFTSTCGVIGPSLNEPMSEKDPRIMGFGIEYELTKKMGEDIAFQYAKEGMNIVVVCPSKVYGPGNISYSLTINTVIDKFLKKRIVFIPSPGTYKASFAFIDDVMNGHLLAMEKGKGGEKYILGGINISYQEFFDHIGNLSSCKGHIIRLSKNTIKGWALLQQLNYNITGTHPRFTVRAIDHLFSNYTFSSEKAVRELGYRITPLEEALKKTIHFLKNKPRA